MYVGIFMAYRPIFELLNGGIELLECQFSNVALRGGGRGGKML
jgi:hypothetical protein